MNHKAAILMIPLVHMIATNLHIFNISYYGEETFNAYHFQNQGSRLNSEWILHK